MSHATGVVPGLVVVHANRLDDLPELLVARMRAQPLAPLEQEVLLVHSNSMAQWLKVALAGHPDYGIAAGLEVQFPAQFIWKIYQTVMGAVVPEQEPFDKETLLWRLLRLLPTVVDRPAFATLKAFLDKDADLLKCKQLCAQLARLFDQYQVYRAAWLDDWKEGRDQLRSRTGALVPLAEADLWQAQLWRALLEDAGVQAWQQSRAGLHQQVLYQLSSLAQRPVGVPRRIVVFGISTLPAQNLEVLALLARFSQVFICVQNPCRHYWTMPTVRIEQPSTTASALSTNASTEEERHPLLSGWGRLGRDYLELLEQYDGAAQHQPQLQSIAQNRVDLFVEEPTPKTMLAQLHNDILEQRPVAESQKLWKAVVPQADQSIRFHVAHSPRREVEILHDQLLERFATDAALMPRDVLVMVPDIEQYAPYIEAVFGQFSKEDKRYIPFVVADRQERKRLPILIVLEQLLNLPESRFTVQEVLRLLDVCAVRQRFAIEEADVLLWERWAEDSGIRWGLDAAQRAMHDFPAGLAQNTWHFGIQRMLLGYAVGAGTSFEGVAPYPEVAGLQAAGLGALLGFLESLEAARTLLAQDYTPEQWGVHLRALVHNFFTPEEKDQYVLAELHRHLETWVDTCKRAQFDTPLPLSLVREAWLSALDQGEKKQQIMHGAVHFCTLLPMRAIPFPVVCLLGMNHQDYPRKQVVVDFDLMRDDYRAGDRSRREDDRYLFLEALLSARQQLYISWVGRHLKDNTKRMPSVLVEQLRAHLASVWRLSAQEPEAKHDPEALLAALTQEHPLHPFSQSYFPSQAATGFFTYAQEWRSMHLVQSPLENGALALWLPQEPLTAKQLSAFMRAPVQAFFEQRLKVFFTAPTVNVAQEPFTLNNLEHWQMRAHTLITLKEWVETQYEPALLEQQIEQTLSRIQQEGRLPLAGFAAVSIQKLRAELPGFLTRYHQALQRWPIVVEAYAVQVCARSGVQLLGMVDDIRTNQQNQQVRIELLQKTILDAKNAKKISSMPWRQLISVWVKHLWAQRIGGAVTTVLIGLDDDLYIPPVAYNKAQSLLKDLLNSWSCAMQSPLPVACDTAFTWLRSGAAVGGDAALEEARKCFEGASKALGEVEKGYAMALRRAYPDFASLTATGAFNYWTERLYQPLFVHIKEIISEDPTQETNIALDDTE